MFDISKLKLARLGYVFNWLIRNDVFSMKPLCRISILEPYL